MITDYQIISGTIGIVTEVINTHIKNGWQPHGDLVTSFNADLNRIIFSQVIVKYEPLQAASLEEFYVQQRGGDHG